MDPMHSLPARLRRLSRLASHAVRGLPRKPAAILLGSAVALLLAATPAWASHPFGTDDAATIGGHAVGFELSSAIAVGGARDLDLEVALVVQVGLLDRLDVGVAFQLRSARGGPGGWNHEVYDPVFGLKASLTDPDGAVPGIALRVDYRPPVFSSTLGSGHDLAELVAATWEPSERWAWHVNLGGAWRAASTSRGHVALLAGVCANWLAADTLGLGLELTTEVAADLREVDLGSLVALQWEVAVGHVISVGAGPSWRVGEAVQWQATVGYSTAVGP